MNKIDIKTAKEIVIVGHEGLVSRDLSLLVDSKKLCVNNCQENWEALKYVSENGVNVIDRHISKDQTATDKAFKDSEPYKVRFNA